jgi:hypothetical protein
MPVAAAHAYPEIQAVRPAPPVSECTALLANPLFSSAASAIADVLARSHDSEIPTMRRDIGLLRRHGIPVPSLRPDMHTVKGATTMLGAVASGKVDGFDYLLARVWVDLRDILRGGGQADVRTVLLHDLLASVSAIRPRSASAIPRGQVMPLLVTLLLRRIARIDYADAGADLNWAVLRELHPHICAA